MWQYLTRRLVVGVVLLTVITGGLYGLIWFVNTKHEMNRAGAKIPSAWLLIIPLANIWWMWEWAGGVALVTRNRQTQLSVFLLVFLVHVVGVGIVQSAFNQAIDESEPAQLPEARVV